MGGTYGCAAHIHTVYIVDSLVPSLSLNPLLLFVLQGTESWVGPEYEAALPNRR